jgi:hypothetical protein
MSNAEKVWLAPPHGQGEPREVEATPEILVPMLVVGWRQCTAPMAPKEKNPHVDD